jgi:hypothetical protein
MAKTVKDVSSHEFVRSYAAHLKRSGKVLFLWFNVETGLGSLSWVVYSIYLLVASGLMSTDIDTGQCRNRHTIHAASITITKAGVLHDLIFGRLLWLAEEGLADFL